MKNTPDQPKVSAFSVIASALCLLAGIGFSVLAYLVQDKDLAMCNVLAVLGGSFFGGCIANMTIFNTNRV